MLCFFCMECRDKTLRSKRYNAYSVVATHDKCPRVDFAFARQPWAIKRTTLTALHHESIHIEKFIHWYTGTIPMTLRRYNMQNCRYIHWYTGTIPMTLRRYNIYHGGYIHYNTGIKYIALHKRNIHYVGYIHWNTDTTPTALPIGNTHNIGYLHLKNMNIFVDVFTFILQFFISTHIHFRPFTYNSQLAK